MQNPSFSSTQCNMSTGGEQQFVRPDSGQRLLKRVPPPLRSASVEGLTPTFGKGWEGEDRRTTAKLQSGLGKQLLLPPPLLLQVFPLPRLNLLFLPLLPLPFPFIRHLTTAERDVYPIPFSLSYSRRTIILTPHRRRCRIMPKTTAQ